MSPEEAIMLALATGAAARMMGIVPGSLERQQLSAGPIRGSTTVRDLRHSPRVAGHRYERAPSKHRHRRRL